MKRRASPAVLALLAVFSPGEVGGGPPRFEDVTREAGIRFRHENGATGKLHYPEIMGGGVILFDADGDGWLDIYFLNGNFLGDRPADPRITNVLYHNDSAAGPLEFTDVTAEAGVGDPSYGQGGEAADFDGDGDLDLYVSNIGQDILYRNVGHGHFTRVPLSARLGWGQTCAALDFDHDGDLDLFVANYLAYDPLTEPVGTTLIGGKVMNDYRGPQVYRGLPSVLLRNDGDLVFSDVTQAVGLFRPDGKGMGLAAIDIDGDGWVDIYQANDSMENFLFMNHAGKFEEVGLISGCALGPDGAREASMGVDIADLNGDGRPDLMVPCLSGEIHTLYRNEWPWFTDASVEYGLHLLTRSRTGFSPSFLDYDDDGDEDLFISCGRVRLASSDTAIKEGSTFVDRYGERPLLLENAGHGKFQSAEGAAGPYFTLPHVGRGTAVGDLNNDGRLDLVVSHAGGEPAVLINRSAGGHWLTLKLVGRGMNSQAIGAHLAVRAGGKTQHRWVHGGGSYLSVSDRRVHLGLGEAAAAERIEITWPMGKKQVLENVAADRFLTVEEPEK